MEDTICNTLSRVTKILDLGRKKSVAIFQDGVKSKINEHTFITVFFVHKYLRWFVGIHSTLLVSV